MKYLISSESSIMSAQSGNIAMVEFKKIKKMSMLVRSINTSNFMVLHTSHAFFLFSAIKSMR
jgi:hypothetical protein